MSDLTIVYYTANQLPDHFAGLVRRILLEAVGGRFPIVTVSQGPLVFGDTQIDIGTPGPSVLTLYRQVLEGARAATTPYVALCEDDTLYSASHFTAFRPPLDTFAYDHAKWGLYTWGPAVFSTKTNRSVLNQCIAPRLQLIAALEERFAKTFTPDRIAKHFAEPGRYERWLGVTIQKLVTFTAPDPSIVISHEWALGYQHLGQRKRLGELRCDALPGWGTAAEVRQRVLGHA